MAQTQQRPRGSYAKGVAKREEILERALDVIARQGYRGASVKEIADAVGLSQAGLLHYFGTKEELFVEILRKRDEVDRRAFGASLGDPDDIDGIREGYVGSIRHNADVPGLVELFSRLAVEAVDAEHPAHEYFLKRGGGLRQAFAAAAERAQAAGQLTERIDADTMARLLQAVADGMQLQWMLDPDVDMSGVIEALFVALTPEKESS